MAKKRITGQVLFKENTRDIIVCLQMVTLSNNKLVDLAHYCGLRVDNLWIRHCKDGQSVYIGIPNTLKTIRGVQKKCRGLFYANMTIKEVVRLPRQKESPVRGVHLSYPEQEKIFIGGNE